MRVDGKDIYRSPKVFGKDHAKRQDGVSEPLDIRVNVTGAKTLCLVVDFTDPPPKAGALPLDDHVLDRADWVAARLVK